MSDGLGLWQRAALLRAGMSRPPTTFVSFPEPRARGLAARGIQYTSGNFIIDGEVVEAPNRSIWEVGQTSLSHQMAAHKFEWVDDLIAAGSPRARHLMVEWFDAWLGDHEGKSNDTWDPLRVAHRLIRLLNHGALFLQGRDSQQHKRYFTTVSKHYRYLGYTWQALQDGLPQITALVALLFAAHATQSSDAEFQRFVTKMGETCRKFIGEDGGIPSRNPEELMQIFSLLSWTSRVIEALDIPMNKGILRGLELSAPCLRSLRFANGNLSVFQSGGPGMEGRLDQALADGRVRAPANPDGAMGYQRLSAARSMLIVDAGVPRSLPSLGAFEFAAGRHPIIVNSGASGAFGERWAEKGRRSAAHSMPIVNRTDSSLNVGAASVTREVSGDANSLVIRHEGYLNSYGILIERRFTLSNDGQALGGEDHFILPNEAARKTYLTVARGASHLRVPVSLHFHLAAEADVQMNLGGTITSINLPNDQVWGFRKTSGKLTLKPSVLMTPNRLRPLATQQIHLAADVGEEGLKLSWLLERLS
ncbi:MAG: heparinase II/III family protein [Pseudomonadota bacterium]